MTDAFRELYSVLQLDRKKSAWSREQTIHTRLTELAKEIVETQEALDSGDKQHTGEELADMLWDMLSIIVIAEEQGIGTVDSFLEKSIDKISRRKPWIFTDEEVSVEEELCRWKEIKKHELENGLRRG